MQFSTLDSSKIKILKIDFIDIVTIYRYEIFIYRTKSPPPTLEVGGGAGGGDRGGGVGGGWGGLGGRGGG